MFFWLDGNGFEDSNGNNKSNNGGESKVESDVKKGSVYRKDKKLL